jgi:hypothetical protein
MASVHDNYYAEYLSTTLPRIAASALFFTIVYVVGESLSKRLSSTYAHLPRTSQIDWSTRVASMIHACIVLPLSIYGLYFEGELPKDVIFKTSYVSSLVTAISGGYFVWDLMICIKHLSIIGYGFLLHAVYCGIVFLGVQFPPMLHYFALTYLLYEATTVFMNPFVMMEMLKTHPTKKRGDTFHKVQFYISVCFALLFLVIRMIGGNYYLYLLWEVPSARLSEMTEYHQIMWKIFFTMGVISSLLNTYWFAEIVKQATGVLFGGKTEDPKKGSEANGKSAKGVQGTSASKASPKMKAKKDK